MRCALLILALVALAVVGIATGPSAFEQVVGVLLTGVALVDVFLTVLYARMGYGMLSREISRAAWSLFAVITKPLGRFRGTALSLCGPLLLVTIVLSWLALLTVGSAMIMQPVIGRSIFAQIGESKPEFITALYAAAANVTIIGSGTFTPITDGYRLYFSFATLLSVSVVTLTLTYLMQVYAAVQKRNSLALELHLLTGETGDAVEMLAAIGACGRFDIEHNKIFELASELTSMKEAHHHYPIIFYFRFPDPFYAPSRIALVALDCATLVKTALDREKYDWLVASAAVDLLSRSAFTMVEALERNFVTKRPQDIEPTDADRLRWRERYFAAVRRLEQAGIATTREPQVDVERYVAMRVEWYERVMALAPSSAHPAAVIDPAGYAPETIDERKPFAVREKTLATT